MRLLGHPGSDLDETWWKLFPGVSRSFLNSSGTKITGKNTQKKTEIQNFKKFKFTDSRHAQLSIYEFFMRNPIIKSKLSKSNAQRPKNRKN